MGVVAAIVAPYGCAAPERSSVVMGKSRRLVHIVDSGATSGLQAQADWSAAVERRLELLERKMERLAEKVGNPCRALKINEYARYVGISRSAVWQKIQAGELHTVTTKGIVGPGHCRLVVLDDLADPVNWEVQKKRPNGDASGL
jgi:hypothetical protein